MTERVASRFLSRILRKGVFLQRRTTGELFCTSNPLLAEIHPNLVVVVKYAIEITAVADYQEHDRADLGARDHILSLTYRKQSTRASIAEKISVVHQNRCCFSMPQQVRHKLK